MTQIIKSISLGILLLLNAQQWQIGGRSLVSPAGGGGTTIAAVGTPTCGGQGSSTTASVTYTPHAIGDTLIVTITDYISGTGTISSVSDGVNTWTTLAASPTSGNSYPGVLVAGALATTTASATTISATLSNATQYGMCVQEYSGVVAFGHTAASATYTISGTYTQSITTQDPNNVVVCALGTYGSTPTATSGTIRAIYTADNGNTIQDNTSATAGVVTVAGTLPSSQNWAMGCAELRTL